MWFGHSNNGAGPDQLQQWSFGLAHTPLSAASADRLEKERRRRRRRRKGRSKGRTRAHEMRQPSGERALLHLENASILPPLPPWPLPTCCVGVCASRFLDAVRRSHLLPRNILRGRSCGNVGKYCARARDFLPAVGSAMPPTSVPLPFFKKSQIRPTQMDECIHSVLGPQHLSVTSHLIFSLECKV